VATDFIYIPNPLLGATWQNGPDAWDVMGDVGSDIEGYADSIVPVDTGELKASIKVVKEEVDGAAGVAVVADSDHSLPVEYGTRFMDAQPYLRPALDAVVGGGD